MLQSLCASNIAEIETWREPDEFYKVAIVKLKNKWRERIEYMEHLFGS